MESRGCSEGPLLHASLTTSKEMQGQGLGGLECTA